MEGNIQGREVFFFNGGGGFRGNRGDGEESENGGHKEGVEIGDGGGSGRRKLEFSWKQEERGEGEK